MRHLYLILSFILMAFFAKSQPDSIPTSKKLIDAPDELKTLINHIKQKEASYTKSDAEIEIDGLLVNDTKTKNGTEFYEYFYRDWQPPINAKSYSVFITEKPFRMSTTMIEIKINETLVFQSYMQPRSDVVEMLAKQAVEQAINYLENYESILKQLEGEDRSGSGIF